jgi:hypothetical protein
MLERVRQNKPDRPNSSDADCTVRGRAPLAIAGGETTIVASATSALHSDTLRAEQVGAVSGTLTFDQGCQADAAADPLAEGG